MSPKIYGVELNSKITPTMVRDAIILCFTQAHSKDTEMDSDLSKNYCHQIVVRAFEDAGADFENPTKEGILGAMNNLAEFAKNFRRQDEVKQNYESIMKLVNKLD